MPVYAWNRDHHHFASPMFGAKTSAMMALKSLYSSSDAKRTCATCCNWDASARVRISAGMHEQLFSRSGILSASLVLDLEKFVGKVEGEISPRHSSEHSVPRPRWPSVRRSRPCVGVISRLETGSCEQQQLEIAGGGEAGNRVVSGWLASVLAAERSPREEEATRGRPNSSACS